MSGAGSRYTDHTDHTLISRHSAVMVFKCKYVSVTSSSDDQWADGNMSRPVSRHRLTSEWKHVGWYMYSHKEAKREANFMKQV